MDIVGLGDSAVDQLVALHLVNDVSGLYTLTKEQLMGLELFADKKADNLLAQIEASKRKSLDRVLFGLGIRHVGEKTAEVLATRFSIDQLLTASPIDFEAVADIGPTVSQSLYSFFSSESGQKLIARLRAHGLTMTQVRREISATAPFTGMTFVFTGELESMTRDEAEEKVKSLGGKASSSVSSKTSYVVAGPSAGSKLKKAKELGVKVITETEFQEMVK
jgi:DNA ligase (NAD+)